MNLTIKKMTKTAVFLALLLVLQFLTKLTNVQLLTGSVVNLILVLSLFYCGLFGGIIIAAISPILAFFLGITPLASFILVPFIMLGNITYILIIRVFIYKIKEKKYFNEIIGIILGSFAKFVILFCSIKFICIPYIIELKTIGLDSFNAATLSNTITISLTTAFGLTQFLTAMIGGIFSLLFINFYDKYIQTTPNKKI